jgi:hypothetical protein
MVTFVGCLLASLIVTGCASSAAAETHHVAQTAPSVASSPGAARPLTGKERLGPKWTDEQRIDNCNVPIDKRGAKPRPIPCPDQLTH